MSNRYQLYVANTLKLIETIVIKSEETVELLNKWVVDYFGVSYFDESDPLTWKYYLNISGEYHSTDKEMLIVSWDTLETIIFNKENLAIHRSTYKAYSYGTTQYAELVKKYPNQEMLILGILNPTDINTAIAAEDGTVLTYDNSLVEENEYSLIRKLDAWIKSFKVRWVNRQFEISDELYAATNHGIMYLNLVPVTMNFRLEACKTNEAHSYHIGEYLLSHGIHETSIFHMTKRQMLFFYRNINYIQRNAGKQDTFNWILQHIMTERFLPMAEFVMKHNDAHQLDNLYPAITFRNKNLNNVYGEQVDPYVDLHELLAKEDEIAIDNAKYGIEEYDKIETVFETSKSSTVKTKVLESSVIDYTESGQNKFDETLLQHWLYYSVTGFYKAHIGINNPITNERIPLNAKDAFTLMMYAFCQSIGIDLIYVPKILAKRVQRNPLPTVSELMSIVDKKYIKSTVANEMLSYSPEVKEIKSTEAFNIFCGKIHRAMKSQRNMSALQEHMYRRGLVQNMFDRIYCDVLCELEPVDTTYHDWFNSRTLDFSSFAIGDYKLLYLNIVKEMTGVALEEEPNLQSLQKAMIKLFESLSSYSIQFVKRINSSGIINFNLPMVRIGDINGSAGTRIELFDAVAEVTNINAGSKHRIDFDVTPNNVSEVISTDYRGKINLDMNPDISFKPNKINIRYEMNSAPVMFNSIEVIIN